LDVLALHIYFGGYFGGQPKTYPPCIMDLHVLGASYRDIVHGFLIYIEGVLDSVSHNSNFMIAIVTSLLICSAWGISLNFFLIFRHHLLPWILHL
jgi:hypothetical protein